jgi:hypothetical protein
MTAILRSHVRVGLAIAVGSLAVLSAGITAYQIGLTDGRIVGQSEGRVAAATLADEALTQAVRIYADGTVRVTQYHRDGDALVGTRHVWCVDGALCDDSEPTTQAPGA